MLKPPDKHFIKLFSSASRLISFNRGILYKLNYYYKTIYNPVYALEMPAKEPDLTIIMPFLI